MNIKHMDHCKKKRQAMYIYRNIEVHSHNHCSHGKAICIKYYECVCVCILYLVIWHANHIFSASQYIIICDLSGCNIFSSTLSHKRHDFGGECY